MDATQISDLLSSFGFPVVMCGALFWHMIQQNKTHSEETTSMREAINELKIAITKLCEKLGGN